MVPFPPLQQQMQQPRLSVMTDGNPEGVAEIKKGGNWVADVAQDPAGIGKTTLEAIKKHLEGEKVDSEILIAPYIIDAKNAK